MATGPVLVLHSTEGTTIEGAVATLRRNRSESNWVADPETGEVVTLTDSEWGDRSLRNLPGGVETNNRPGVWQLEIVAFATDVPHMPEHWFRRLGAIVSSLCEAKGIPRAFPRPFVAYPASYGLKAAQRLSGAQWLAVAGIVGHQHVPENTHGDPGDISRLIPYVTTEETDMPPPITYQQAMAELDELWLAYRGEMPSEADRRAWARDTAEKIFNRGDDLRPTLAYIEWVLREQFLKAAGK